MPSARNTDLLMTRLSAELSGRYSQDKQWGKQHPVVVLPFYNLLHHGIGDL